MIVLFALAALWMVALVVISCAGRIGPDVIERALANDEPISTLVSSFDVPTPDQRPMAA